MCVCQLYVLTVWVVPACVHTYPSVPRTQYVSLSLIALSYSTPQLNAKLQELEEGQRKLLEENSEVNGT